MITEAQIFTYFDTNPSISLSSKTIYKYWSGLSKLLYHKYQSKGQVTYEPFGSFSLSTPNFQPSPIFLSCFNYSACTNFKSTNRISSSSLSELCDLSISEVRNCVKQMISLIVAQVKLSITVRLNLKIGFLVLQTTGYQFIPSGQKINYHASNPNPINDDSSSNVCDFNREKLKFSKVNLPPLFAQSRTSPKIVCRHSRKQFIQPYVPAYEIMKSQVNRDTERKISKTPENTSLVLFSCRDRDRFKTNMTYFL